MSPEQAWPFDSSRCGESGWPCCGMVGGLLLARGAGRGGKSGLECAESLAFDCFTETGRLSERGPKPMTSHLCSVGVYSRQDIVREGLVSLLSKHPRKVCIVQLPTEPGHSDADVVLYDVIALLEGDTGPLTYLVEMTTSKVLAVGRDLRPDLVSHALRAGVDGFFDIG